MTTFIYGEDGGFILEEHFHNQAIKIFRWFPTFGEAAEADSSETIPEVIS